MLKQYDPDQILVYFKGIRITGFAEGTFLQAERAEDAYQPAVGATGEVARVRNRNRMGSVTATLMQTSNANDLLSAVQVTDELLGTGVGPLMVKDLGGTTLVQAEAAWIRRPPNAPYATEMQTREWVFDCADLQMKLGGNVSVV